MEERSFLENSDSMEESCYREEIFIMEEYDSLDEKITATTQ